VLSKLERSIGPASLRFAVEAFRGILPMAVKRVIDGVHVVPMGLANAFLIEGDD
jgi:hypothetical protein